MRILHLTHNYPRHDGDLAGAFIERLVLAQAALGHGVAVLTPSDAGAAGDVARGGVTVHRVRYAPARWETLAHTGTMASALGSPAGLAAFASLVTGQARAARRFARSGTAELVHAHWWIPGGASAWLARTWGGAPYVVTLHGTDVALLDRSAFARALARRVLRGAAAVTAVSAYVAAKAAAVAGLTPGTIWVQPMPLDTGQFARTSAGGGGVVTVGRLTAQKRVGMILDAVAALKGRGRRLALTIVGDGPERVSLEAQASHLGIADQTRFTGAVEPARVAGAIGDADVFAFTAVGEGYGLAAAEALALGVPVVAMADGGGATEIAARAGAGRVVPADDAGALERAIDELAASPDARNLAAVEGARLKGELEAGAVARRFDEVYRRALAGRRIG
jgi:glycosyltransferase involved in cell wall biosynthesis